MEIFKQTSWQLIGKVFTAASTLLILSLVSRNLGVGATGVFTLALTYLSFFYLAADFSLNTHALHTLVKENTHQEFQKLLGLRLVWATILVLLALLLLFIWPNTEVSFAQAVVYGVLAILGYAIYTTANALFQAKLRYDLSIIAPIVGIIPTLGIIYLAIQNKLGIPGLMVGHMLGWLVCGAVSLYFVKKFTPLFPIFSLNYFKEVTGAIWPISLTLVLNTVYFRIDSFILAFTKSFYEVGLYNLSYQVFQFGLVIPTFIMNSLFPMLLKDYQKTPQIFLKTILRASFIMFNLGLIGTVSTFLLAPLVINIISGQGSFNGSAESLKILSLGFPAFFVSAVIMWSLVVLKQYKQILGVYIFGLIINLSLNLLLIPQFSYLGAAFVTGISEYLILSLLIIILYKVLRKS